MITPTYQQIEPGSSFSAELWGKWYCVYFETSGDHRFPRYMSPDGWQRVCYYFPSKQEAELAFAKYGWCSFTVTPQEIRDKMSMEEDLHRWEVDDYDYD